MGPPVCKIWAPYLRPSASGRSTDDNHPELSIHPSLEGHIQRSGFHWRGVPRIFQATSRDKIYLPFIMCIQWNVRCSYYADSIVVNKRKTCETSMPTAEETESLCQIFQEVRAQHRSVRQPSLWTKAWNPIISQVICMVMRTPCQKVIGALVLPWLSFHRSMLSASTQCPNYGIRSNDVTATTDRTRVGWKWFLVSMLRVTKKLTHCFWERLWHGCFIWSLPTKSLASTVGSPTRASPHDELYFFPVPAARVECFLRYSAAAQQASW